MAWKEVAFRKQWQAPAMPTLEFHSGSPSAPLSARTTALAFGLSSSEPTLQSTEQLLLRATILASLGESRALIGAQGRENVYHIGDSLPGGSVLRHIEAQYVVLWRAGREESLPLIPPARHLLDAVGTLAHKPVIPTQHLLPGKAVQP